MSALDRHVHVLRVAEVGDGMWSVTERGPSRVAIAYFPAKFGAIKHAIRVALRQHLGEVQLHSRDGSIITALYGRLSA